MSGITSPNVRIFLQVPENNCPTGPRWRPSWGALAYLPRGPLLFPDLPSGTNRRPSPAEPHRVLSQALRNKTVSWSCSITFGHDDAEALKALRGWPPTHTKPGPRPGPSRHEPRSLVCSHSCYRTVAVWNSKIHFCKIFTYFLNLILLLYDFNKKKICILGR